MIVEIVGLTGLSIGWFFGRRWAIVYTDEYDEDWLIHKRFFTKDGATEYVNEEHEEFMPLPYGTYGYIPSPPYRSKMRVAYIPWNPLEPIQILETH